MRRANIEKEGESETSNVASWFLCQPLGQAPVLVAGEKRSRVQGPGAQSP